MTNKKDYLGLVWIMLCIGLLYPPLLLVYLGRNMAKEPLVAYNRKAASRESSPCLDPHFQTFHKSFHISDWYVHIYEGREKLHTKRNPVKIILEDEFNITNMAFWTDSRYDKMFSEHLT